MAGKYLQCRFGLFALRDLFSRPVHTNELTETQIKKRLAELIREEDPACPMSDRRLSELLEEKDRVTLARRTVAKYRDALGIPAAQNRRKRS